jgi:hypothetical protein
MLRGQGVGIEAHLVNLSKLAHLALVIYRRQRTKFIPAQNFQNTMRMIRAIFWSVKSAQNAGVKEYFLFLDSTDPLENLFGIVRSLHGSGTAFDAVQLEDRLTTAMTMAQIYARHPDWQKRQRRLHGSFDHQNPLSWVSTLKRSAEDA